MKNGLKEDICCLVFFLSCCDAITEYDCLCWSLDGASLVSQVPDEVGRLEGIPDAGF